MSATETRRICNHQQSGSICETDYYAFRVLMIYLSKNIKLDKSRYNIRITIHLRQQHRFVEITLIYLWSEILHTLTVSITSASRVKRGAGCISQTGELTESLY